jgi:hypothetical protein
VRGGSYMFERGYELNERGFLWYEQGMSYKWAVGAGCELGGHGKVTFMFSGLTCSVRVVS